MSTSLWRKKCQVRKSTHYKPERQVRQDDNQDGYQEIPAQLRVCDDVHSDRQEAVYEGTVGSFSDF